MADDQNPFFDEEPSDPKEPEATTNGIGDTTEISLDGEQAAGAAKPEETVDLEKDEDGEGKPEPGADTGGAAASVDVTNISEPSEFSSTPVEVPPQKNQEKTQAEEEEEEDAFDIDIKITKPEKVGDGMNAYMVYTVTTNTSMPSFKNPESAVRRRFSDFLGLHERLNGKYLHLGRIVPPAPEKSVIGMGKVKFGKDESGNPAEFINRRRAALERYLNRLATHQILCQDPDFREFLEADELPRAKDTAALSGGGLKRLVKSVGDTMFNLTAKMTESDQWFEEKQQQIETLDQQLKKLHQCVETLVIQRKELGLSTAAFAKSTAMLSNSEEHSSLSRALSQLAEVEEKIEELHMHQADTDFYVFSELLKDYICLIQAVKASFQERVKTYSTWQHAQQTLTKKREALVRLELANKNEKLPAAQEEVKEWEQKVEKGQEDFEKISEMIRKEMKRFERKRVKDFKEAVIKYLEALMENQQQLVKHWEGFLPEAKAIA